MTADKINWPVAHRPDGADILACNQLTMAAPRERVWAWLVRADLWSRYYSNALRLRIVEGPGAELVLGTVFTWWTFGLRVTTRVTEFEPPARLAWTGEALGATGHHAWLIEARNGGCHVTTVETQRGIAPRIVRPLMRPAMLHYHQKWLEGLKRVAERGAPPAP